MTEAKTSPVRLLELNTADGDAPEWVQLIPAGPGIRGVDGRVWTMTDAGRIVETFRNRGVELPIDIEHATQVKGARGEEAPAVGWIHDMQARDGGLWGKVSWTPRGEALLRDRAYRYLSPVFSAGRRTGAVTRLVSAGLTNNPNLDLVALNRQGAEPESVDMDEDVLEALGLNADASAADAVAAIGKLKAAESAARNRARTPSLDAFVPRKDYDRLVRRVHDFEAADKARGDAAIEAAVDAAIEAAKITPADRDFYIASCRAEGGLERFGTFIESKPEIAPESGLDGKTPGAGATSALTEEELAACRALGLSEDDFTAAKAKG